MRALAQIWAMSQEANAEALRLSQEAIRLDATYATAYAYASWCHFWGFANNWTASHDYSRAEASRLIQRALLLDGNDPNVLTIAALNATAIAHDLDAAAAYVEKALKLDPNFTWGWNRSGYVEIYRDNIDTALAHFDRAAMLSPFDPLTFNRLVGAALAHYAAGRYEKAVGLAEQARREKPGLPWAYRVLAAANVEVGRLEDARAAVATLNADVPSQTVERVMSSMPFRRTDIRERFAAALQIAGMPTARPAEAAVSA
jgi:tetratricopeptide (TPR) repeat protein